MALSYFLSYVLKEEVLYSDKPKMIMKSNLFIELSRKQKRIAKIFAKNELDEHEPEYDDVRFMLYDKKQLHKEIFIIEVPDDKPWWRIGDSDLK